MRRCFLLLATLVLASCASTDRDAAEAIPAAGIELTANGREDWTVSYRLPAPATELVFARSPDDSRGRDWRAPDGFEIVMSGEAEAVRRTDGAPFRSVTLAVPPLYRFLPKDYAPFAPFGDGGMLVHSGRFFACGGPCSDGASWTLKLATAGDSRILLNGADHGHAASWIDTDSGRNVYVGAATPVETPDFVAVIDGALPDDIRRQMGGDFPAFMRAYAGRLGAVDERPMMFVSYDLSHPGGDWGRQGGVLPGQVFMHFYGPVWPQEMKKPGFANDLSWHFAHEAAHIHQNNVFTMDGGSAWVHEGAAEAFAYLLMRDTGDAAYAEGKLAQARKDCDTQLQGRSVTAAINASTFQVAYSCGLLLNLYIDAEVKAQGRPDGLYQVWRDWMASIEAGARPTKASYLAAVSRSGGAELAARIEGLTDEAATTAARLLPSAPAEQ